MKKTINRLKRVRLFDTRLPRLISGQLRLPEAQAAAEDTLA
jgi:hypothetical protein